MLTLVIARYNEEINWINHVWKANVVVINKQEIGNFGREAASYLWFIIHNYETLQGDYVFCQADPFPHWPSFLTDIHNPAIRHFGLVCKWPECHAGANLLKAEDIIEFCRRFQRLVVKRSLEVDLNCFYFASGAQFRVSAGDIRFRSIDYYRALYHLTLNMDRAPWIIEALWGHIIPALALKDVPMEKVHFGKTTT